MEMDTREYIKRTIAMVAFTRNRISVKSEYEKGFSDALDNLLAVLNSDLTIEGGLDA